MTPACQLQEIVQRGTGDIGALVAVMHRAGSGVTPGTYYTHHNHRGDVIITRSGTTTVGTYEYTAFGNLKSSIGNDLCRFGFSSKERDLSTGFYYYGYRFYAPAWQRWVSRDPIGEDGGLNLYGYVDNAPVVFFDILGTGKHCDEWRCEKQPGEFLKIACYLCCDEVFRSQTFSLRWWNWKRRTFWKHWRDLCLAACAETEGPIFFPVFRVSA